MTPREIVLANINHTGAPRPAMNFHDRGRMNDFHGGWRPAPANHQGRRWEEGVYEFYDDEWGNLWKRMIGGCAKGEIHQAVLKDWDQLKDMKIPHYDVDRVADHFRASFAQDREQKFHIAGIGGWVFDNARYIRNMETYFMDMALYPEELMDLHEKVGSVYEKLIHAAGKAKADGIMIGEDMGTQEGLLFSPNMFREYFKDLYTHLMSLAHDYGMKVLMHSCGSNREILEDLCDCGVDAFQFDQPTVYNFTDLSELLDRRGGALYSPVDIQKVLPTGDRAFIEAQTLEMLKAFDGKLICKVYPDLHGIGVKEEWDQWAYETILRAYDLELATAV